MSFAKQILESSMEYGAPCNEGDYDDYPEAWKPEMRAAVAATEARHQRITNVNGLPEPLVKAVSRHPHDHVPGRISVTGLIQPPQLRALSILHKDEITEDAADRIWSLLGNLLHGVLERNAKGMKDTITEQELVTEVLGWQVVGHYDLSEMVLEGELLTDWKLTSVWAMKDGVKPEWEQQLNCYAELIRRSGRYVSQVQIVAIGRDWSKSKARYEKTYPQQQVQVFSVPLWTPEEASEFLEARVALHQEAEKGNYQECTPDERWARQDQWAVMKKGQRKAVKLYDTLESATRHAGDDPNFSVAPRPGESVRCESYCPVSQWCGQFAKIKAAKPVAGLKPLAA